MEIAFFELEDWEKKYFEENLKDHQLSFYGKPLTKDFGDTVSAEIISTFIYSKIDSETLSKLPNLKFIATRSTGFDHIDISKCKELDIKVGNVPSYGENTVAEHTFALILALSRKVIDGVEETRAGNFDLKTLRGFDLKGKTIGVIGTGKIGSRVVRMAHGFEMRIVCFDIVENSELVDKYGVKYVSLDELMSSSDIISLHMPLNEKTKYLISDENIGKIKKGAYIINTARGALIKTTALLRGLKEGIVAGAGLDVLEGEADIKEEWQILSDEFSKERMTINLANNIILKDKRVIVTPHDAFNSAESLRRILDTTKENIESFISGKPTNLVD
ncbi:MAG: hydroxyacid dehydrogenase [Candidatus Paceibacterota bacterium]|jgi:D-lactate dehydrogenase